MASISHLDETNALRFQRGRTNWEYLRELVRGGHERPCEALRRITSTFDRKFYGRETCGRRGLSGRSGRLRAHFERGRGIRRSHDTWVLIALFCLLLVGSYFAASPGKTTESKSPTTYNANPKGMKALHPSAAAGL